MSWSEVDVGTIYCAPRIKGRSITTLSKESGMDLTRFMQCIIEKDEQEGKEAFYVLDIGVVLCLMDKWKSVLPMVRPYYAVKCNPEAALLGVLATLGSNFDCASQAEIDMVLSIGVSPHRIVYANPCKPESHIKYASSVGVTLTTFDSVYELEKIQKWHPQCDLLMRIKPPHDSGARCPMDSKYGALSQEILPLLQAAKSLQLNVVGVSFHIGSGGADPCAYVAAIAMAKRVFEMAARLGLPQMKILDVGGGFTADPQFDEAAAAIKAAIRDYFSNDQHLSIISEPGRFFAESAFTLVANVIGKRVRGEVREYWINDGIYGSMNCILYDHATITCKPLAYDADPPSKPLHIYSSNVFGPTCDGLDTILTAHQLPDMEVGDWLVFPSMGAYTAAAGSNFNGFNTGAILTHLAHSRTG